jgi:hypothetical protein
MGLYVNPQHMTKQEWLLQYATIIPIADVVSKYETIRKAGRVPVIWVQNPTFDAVAVAVSMEVCKDYTQNKDDHRPKRAFTVAVSDLNEDAGISASELKKEGLS